MNPHYEAVEKAIMYIEAHLKESIDLSILADHVGFSKFYFTRIFREITGMNPYDYLRARKVTEAIHYMEKTSEKIIDVAYEYGFNSPEVFTRSCLSALGKTPSQIRKQYLDKKFIGIPMMNIKVLEQIHDQDTIIPRESVLPTCLIRGTLYSSPQFISDFDFNNPVVTGLLGDSKLLYILNWQSADNPEMFHHLVGVQILPETLDLEKDFGESDHTLFKRIPEHLYLGFPMIHNSKPLSNLQDFIYTHYLPNHPEIDSTSFNVQVLRFDQNNDKYEGILYVPIGNKV